MNFEDYVWSFLFLFVIAVCTYAVWWVVSRAYYYIKFGSTDPIFREKD